MSSIRHPIKHIVRNTCLHRNCFVEIDEHINHEKSGKYLLSRERNSSTSQDHPRSTESKGAQRNNNYIYNIKSNKHALCICALVHVFMGNKQSGYIYSCMNNASPRPRRLLILNVNEKGIHCIIITVIIEFRLSNIYFTFSVRWDAICPYSLGVTAIAVPTPAYTKCPKLIKCACVSACSHVDCCTAEIVCRIKASRACVYSVSCTKLYWQTWPAAILVFTVWILHRPYVITKDSITQIMGYIWTVQLIWFTFIIGRTLGRTNKNARHE